MFDFGFWDGSNKRSYFSDNFTFDYGWGLFLRNENYTGKCCRVQSTASGTPQQDIGFKNGMIDVDELDAFIGSNTGYIVKIYDQWGIKDLESLNWSGTFDIRYAPRIVNAGTLEVMPGTSIPAMKHGFNNGGVSIKHLIHRNFNFFPSRSTSFVTVNTSNDMIMFGNSSSTSYALGCFNGQTFSASVFWDPAPLRVYVNEVLEISGANSGSAGCNSDNHFDAICLGTNKIIAETSIGWNTIGSGHGWGGRANLSQYLNGYSNEHHIKNSVMSQADVFEIQSIINKDLKAY